MAGILHGGPNPVVGATVTLYTTGNDYGASASVVTTAVTDSDGAFNFVLPTTSAACPSGKFAYATAFSGSTGASQVNPNSLLMVPIGSCDSLYSTVSSTDANNVTTYANTYNGPSLWIDELTTAVSAYALNGFMSVSGGVVNIGAPAANTSTSSVATASAAGLAHAFANATNLMNISTGQPYAFMANRTAGGVIPDAEIFLLGNILQACVNSTGATGSNSATSNDGTPCGKLFSLTTPPYSNAATPANTLAAMLNLAKYPNPQVNTWNAGCTAAGTGTTTATNCLFSLAGTSGAYVGALTSAPPDWALAVVYPQTYGVSTTGCTGTCSGINYPYYVSLDYQDNVYVLNADASTATTANVLGFTFDGTPVFSSANDTRLLAARQISTDTAGHVVLTNGASSASALLFVYGTGVNGTAPGQLITTASAPTSLPVATAVDPYNNVFYIGTSSGNSLRRFVYGGSATAPTYTSGTLTPQLSSGGALQVSLDSQLGVYVQEIAATSNSVTTFKVDYAPNVGTLATPAYTSPFVSSQITGAASATSAFGVTVDSSSNAYAASTGGWYKVTKSGTGSGTTLAASSAIALPTTANNQLYTRFLSTDGLNNVYGPDNANGTLSGVSVYDVADGGLALGTYKGCYVVNKVCSTSAGSTPMFSPRAAAISSSGDLWVASGASHNLTELIGAAAPTWPALSMVKTGRPQ